MFRAQPPGGSSVLAESRGANVRLQAGILQLVKVVCYIELRPCVYIFPQITSLLLVWVSILPTYKVISGQSKCTHYGDFTVLPTEKPSHQHYSN